MAENLDACHKKYTFCKLICIYFQGKKITMDSKGAKIEGWFYKEKFTFLLAHSYSINNSSLIAFAVTSFINVLTKFNSRVP